LEKKSLKKVLKSVTSWAVFFFMKITHVVVWNTLAKNQKPYIGVEILLNIIKNKRSR
jgi:hypothetical protein